MKMEWRGVIPAMTTALREDGGVDHEFVARHCAWMVDNGCTGIVALGSLGEGATLTRSEKVEVLKTCVRALEGRAPVVAGISALSTAEAVSLARDAEQAGCSGLMVLPPYVYLGDWRENEAHVAAVSRRPSCPACSTTTRSPTRSITFRSRCRSCWQSTKTCTRLRNRARMFVE